MRRIQTSAFEIAQRFVGLREIPGAMHEPQILAMLKLDQAWPEGDEVPWCSAFVNYVAHLLRLPRSKDLRARSWLRIGEPIHWREAEPGFDLVVLQRGGGNQPGADVIDAPGHVGFFAGWPSTESLPMPDLSPVRMPGQVEVLGGNQSDEVNVSTFSGKRILSIRRLA